LGDGRPLSIFFKMMLTSLFTILIDLSMVGVILGLLTTTLLIDRKFKDTLKIVAVIVVAAAGIWGISSLKKFRV
jgi:hypothetical protein